MKRSKRLYAMLGILVVACIATFAVTQTKEEREQIKATGEIVLQVSSDDVQSLSWEYGETSLAFHKDETWLYDEDEAFPVDENTIHEMLEQFESFGVSFVIEQVTDYGMYGLDDPVCTIHFATEDQSYEIELGDFSNMDEERYVSIGDGNVYLAKVDPLDQFDATLKDMIKHDEDLAYDQVTQIKFEGAENYTIFYEEESAATYCADDVYFTEKDGEILPLDTDRVDNWLESLTTLNPTDYVTYHVTEEELESYNLVEPELTVTVDYTNEDEGGKESSDTFVLSISRNPEELAAAEEAKANGEEAEDVTAYVRIGESQIVYKVSEYNSNRLRAVSYNELRHREVLPADFEDIYQIDVTLEGSDYTIAVDGEKDDERIWKYQEDEVAIDALQDALETLDAEYSSDFLSDDPTGKEEIRLTVHLDNENHPKVDIELYRHDGEDCLAVVDGETFALVPRSDVVDLIEAVNAIVLN
ncbi:DUF4340 domain-containing protein [Eubacteriales bacterium SGI.150]|uniref:DUF4340 domain-containing protein n=1 Tax=Intestinimonas sp. UBA1698 TaxID=1946651 RepID=UPI00257E7BD2|nr:DUF4340 domain-containing protein [Intestinimonas sp. UBA1698]